MLYSVLSMMIALGIIGLSLTSFNYLSGKELSMNVFGSPMMIGGMILFTLFVGFISGSYPAFYLTAFKPTEVLEKEKSVLASGTPPLEMCWWWFNL